MSLRLSVAVLFAMVAGCRGGGPPTNPVKLSSGKTIRVRAVGPLYFTQASPALNLQYETDLTIDDRQALTHEVTEIWQDFRRDADRGNFQAAVITAHEKARGFIITQNRSYNFVFDRRPDGSWPTEATASK